MVMKGDHASGLKFEFGDADAIFYEEDFFRAAFEDFEAAVFFGMRGVPMGRGLAKFVVLEEFDREVMEWLVENVDDVGETAGRESGLAVLQLAGERIFAFDGVDDLGGAEHDVDVVVAMPVHESVGVRGDIDGEGADLGVLEDKVVVRLGGDFDFCRGLRGENGR